MPAIDSLRTAQMRPSPSYRYVLALSAVTLPDASYVNPLGAEFCTHVTWFLAL
jgi:hypothetical protein